jgi:glycine cleavage system aminomethyltransferase T
VVQVPLTNRPGLFALVDDIDADLAGLAWYLKKSKSGFYVARAAHAGYRRDGRRKVKTVRLHRIIHGRKSGQTVPKNLDVHHGPDPDTLNNTRDNLQSVGHVTHGAFSHNAAAFDRWAEARYGPCLSC